MTNRVPWHLGLKKLKNDKNYQIVKKIVKNEYKFARITKLYTFIKFNQPQF